MVVIVNEGFIPKLIKLVDDRQLNRIAATILCLIVQDGRVWGLYLW